MSAKKKHPVLHTAVILALLGGSAYLTVELRKDEQAKAPAVQAVTDTPLLESSTGHKSGKQTWERLKNPERSVLRGEGGQVLATFTDGARTATLKGPSRTFTEPANTKSRVVTEDWVRLMPEPWRKGAEREKWFRDWFKEFYGSEEDDVFAFAFQYLEGAPSRRTTRASRTPVTPTSVRSTRTAARATTCATNSRTSTTTCASRTRSVTASRSRPRPAAPGPWTARASSAWCGATGPATP